MSEKEVKVDRGFRQWVLRLIYATRDRSILPQKPNQVFAFRCSSLIYVARFFCFFLFFTVFSPFDDRIACFVFLQVARTKTSNKEQKTPDGN